jgi:hypothetical protein
MSDQELDIHFAIGFVREWLRTAPEQVIQHLDEIISGVDYYRQKYNTLDEDYQILNKRYNDLTALSAGYLQMIQEQKSQIDQLLIDSQRDLHHERE